MEYLVLQLLGNWKLDPLPKNNTAIQDVDSWASRGDGSCTQRTQNWLVCEPRYGIVEHKFMSLFNLQLCDWIRWLDDE